jgi:TRAP-type C4-dicarboxylate transport system permease small subunit
METFHRTIGRTVEVIDRLSGICLIAIVALNLVAVFMRYVMLDSISWSEEGIRYVAVWMTFLGAAAASWFDEHMDMNMLAEFGGAAFQSWHRALLHALTALFAAFVLWQGVIYCKLNGMQTAPTTGIRMILVYGALALGGLLLLVISLAKIYEAVARPRRPESDHKAVL